MPKPRGTTGATKMKILAIVCYNSECGQGSYGYSIWQTLKTNFHTYLSDDEVRNVYHHLKELSSLGMLTREDCIEVGTNKCFYRLTEKGMSLKPRFEPYLNVVRRNVEHL